MLGIVYFVLYYLLFTKIGIFSILTVIKTISISVILKTLITILIHFLFKKSPISYISIVYKFSLNSFLIIALFVFYISNSIMKDFFNFSIDQISKTSTIETKKTSSQIKIFLLSITSQIENIVKMIESNKDFELRTIYNIIKDNDFIKKFEIYKEEKRILITKDKSFFEIVNTDYKKEKWYKYSFVQTKNSIFGKTLIPDAFVRENEVLIYLTRPVYINNEYWGIIRVETSLNFIYNFLELEHTSEISILDINSYYIFSKRLQDIGKSFTSILDMTDDSNSFKLINNIVLGIPDSGMFVTKDKNYLWIATDIIPEIGWKLVVFRNINDVLDSLNKKINNSIVMVIFILIFAIVFTFSISLRFKSEFRNIKIELMKLENGYISESLLTRRHRLKDELNDMINSIKSVVLKLKELVEKNNIKNVEIKNIIEKMIKNSDSLRKIQDEQFYNIKNENQLIMFLDNKIKEGVKNITDTQKEIKNFNLEFKDANDQIKVTSDIVKKILDTTKKIENITKIMGDVIEETSILALNASVEAAKAGKYAKGFGGIAVEIRRLYKQIDSETIKIKELVNSTLEDINKAGVEIENIKKISQKSLLSLGSLTEKIEKAFEITRIEANEIPNINVFTKNLTKSSENINSLIIEINEISENINNVFKELEKSIEFFKIEQSKR